jgi:hypothetical protein
VFLIGTAVEHRMIQPLWRNDRTFHKTLLAQTGFPVFASVSHMDDQMAHGELEVLAFARIKAHDVYVLNSLALPGLIV